MRAFNWAAFTQSLFGSDGLGGYGHQVRPRRGHPLPIVSPFEIEVMFA